MLEIGSIYKSGSTTYQSDPKYHRDNYYLVLKYNKRIESRREDNYVGIFFSTSINSNEIISQYFSNFFTYGPEDSHSKHEKIDGQERREYIEQLNILINKYIFEFSQISFQLGSFLLKALE